MNKNEEKMSNYEIPDEDFDFIVNELSLIIKSVSEVFGKRGEEYLQRLEQFKESVILSKCFDADYYLALVEEIISIIKDKVPTNGILCDLILSFSRINANVRDIYDRHHLDEDLIKYIGALHEPYSSTDYNDVLIQDYYIAHYYLKGKEILNNDGLGAIVKYLKYDKILTELPNSYWIVQSVIHQIVKKDITLEIEKNNLLGEFAT